MTIQSRIYSVLSLACEWPLVFAEQNAPSPKTAHVTLRFSSARAFDGFERSPGPTVEAGLDTIIQQAVFVVQLDFFGDNAMEAATMSSARFGSQQVLNASYINRTSISRVLSSTDFTFSPNIGQKENRFQLEFEMLAAIAASDDFGKIETVVVLGNYTGSVTEIPVCNPTISGG